MQDRDDAPRGEGTSEIRVSFPLSAWNLWAPGLQSEFPEERIHAMSRLHGQMKWHPWPDSNRQPLG